jgi:alpha-L-fucosidase
LARILAGRTNNSYAIRGRKALMNTKTQTIQIAFSVLLAAFSTLAQTESNPMAVGGNAKDFDMAPETTLKVVETANAMIATQNPPGPFQPTWESLKSNYQVLQWFAGAKFGLFMHWGLYSVPAPHNEWYEKHMYSTGAEGDWHVEHFGPQEKFGYKDFIPMFTCSNWNPDAWAELFKKSGAKFVIPTAEHHDNFALWDSAVTPFNAMNMGPHRDLIGDLSKAGSGGH